MHSLILRQRLEPALPTQYGGFTLVELAVVLVILALLAGTLVVPVSSRMEAQARQQTAAELRDIEHALIGFSILYGRLPCPTTEADPASPAYGIEQSPPCDHSNAGYLPWRTLGVKPHDTWGHPRDSVTSPWDGHWRYRPDASASDSGISATASTSSNLQIRDHDGNPITTVSPSRAAAVIFSTGPNRRADGHNATHSASTPVFEAGEPTAAFDDQLLWIGHPLLVARLAQAGRL